MINYNELIERSFQDLLVEYENTGHRQDVELVTKAFRFAQKAHQNVKRRSGEPYLMHPLAVARIVAREIGLGTTSICAALLHDVVEDTEYTVENIESMFGKRIAKFVDGLTKISGDVFVGKKDVSSQAENFRKVLLTMFDDPRIIMIKIADRLHNMRTLASMPPAKQYKVTGETMYIYAPLAHRLGLFNIKIELENLSFQYEHPEVYDEINQRLAESNSLRENIYLQFIEPIQRRLIEMGYEFIIEKRIKSVYSIWHKMQTKNVTFEEVYDILAVRIIFKGQDNISEKDQSWKIYSVITDEFKPNPERLRDWISTPKSNGYEALHTTVMGPEGQWIEVQIRSERMHEIAEKGLSAHWKYKNINPDSNSASEAELDRWLDNFKEALTNDDPDAIDFLDTVKLNLFATEILIFTPKGETKTMPQNATALDFAFMLHSEIGMQAIGAKVNGKLVPLSHVLSSGDQVEILTSKKQKVQRDWLNFVVTARAKTKIEAVLRKENKTIEKKGFALLEKKLKELNQPADKHNQLVDRLLDYFKVNNRSELYYEIGIGVISLQGIEKDIFKPKGESFLKKYLPFGFGKKDKSSLQPAIEESHSPKINRKKTLNLDDIQGAIHYSIAECCHPIPGDDVLGYVNDDESIILHKQQCPVAAKIKAAEGERIISVEWKSKQIQSFPVDIELRGIDTQGTLMQIVKIISHDHAVNIQAMNLETKDGIFLINIRILVHNTADVNNLCMNLLKIKTVNSVNRIDETKK